MVRTINVHDLKNLVDFSPTQCDFWAENCAVALEEQGKISGALLSVQGDKSTKLKLEWTVPEKTRGYKEKRDWLKYAAVAISCFLVNELTEYDVVEEATQGTGVDYWLGYPETHSKYDALNFMQAKLEVSGIGIETKTNNIQTRKKAKDKQVKIAGHLTLPAYVSIVEFNTPKAFFGKIA